MQKVPYKEFSNEELLQDLHWFSWHQGNLHGDSNGRRLEDIAKDIDGMQKELLKRLNIKK